MRFTTHKLPKPRAKQHLKLILELSPHKVNTSAPFIHFKRAKNRQVKINMPKMSGRTHASFQSLSASPVRNKVLIK